MQDNGFADNEGKGKTMARYQILYWEDIPLGVKATDIESMVRENLPIRFQEAFQQAAAHDQKSGGGQYTTSGFRWSQERERDGTASDVATKVANELVDEWDNSKDLSQLQLEESEPSYQP